MKAGERLAGRVQAAGRVQVAGCFAWRRALLDLIQCLTQLLTGRAHEKSKLLQLNFREPL